MSSSFKLSIVTGATGDPAGSDSALIAVPGYMYATVKGVRVFLAQRAARELRMISENFAARAGERLHHAEWSVTRDPEQVKASMVHDCVRCQAGVDQALALLREHPHAEVAVGRLWWASP